MSIAWDQPTYSGTAGSVAGINAKETTYHISCTKDAPKSLCQIDKPWTMIQAENSWSLTGVYTAWSSEKGGNAVTATQDYSCSFKHWTESPSCSFSVMVTGTIGGGPWSSSASTHLSIPSDKVTSFGLLVTGGVESFTMPQATQTPGAAAAALGAPGKAKAVATGIPLAGAAAVAVAAMF
ncbi:hypothetical protein BDV26DRAFT_254175 [Aspergillus bertholletiae]|uniref:Uncharacterized protein n=1 Tax=Aspergillus bertholletiae TaxID=1226010 RepID=A0A5N7BKB9_9EURO|nr:hypothetical protein BDV26DRAFT_254175 [Aspergillus bertholletiae]